jgi:hypothetical protein
MYIRMQQKTALASVAFLLDVDNTLLDNDALKAHLQSEIVAAGGEALSHRFWEAYEAVRADLDAVSVPVTLERLRREAADPRTIDALGERLFASPFASFVYPDAAELLRWMRRKGMPVILSDGDPWFQAKKITDAGLGAAVNGNVLVFLHKERHVADIERWYPADRYVAIDDKAHLLALLKRQFGERLTTVWVRQGHYAQATDEDQPLATDYSVSTIGDVRSLLERELQD